MYFEMISDGGRMVEIGFVRVACLLVVLAGCNADSGPTLDEQMAEVEAALGQFVVSLESAPEGLADPSDQIKAYVEAQSTSIYGSTVAVLGSDGKVVTSPYWFRADGGLKEIELVTPSYAIDEQEWLRRPIDEQAAVWTEPYFDEGGGDIWMRTRAVPVHDGADIVAVATTDLAVDEPVAQ